MKKLRPFLAAEVLSGHYLFKGLKRSALISSVLRRKNDRAKIKEKFKPSKRVKREPAIFQYNYMHDLESVWMMGVWAILSLEKHPIKKEDIQSVYENAYKRREKLKEIFKGGYYKRIEIIEEPLLFEMEVRDVPDYFKPFVEALSKIGEKLEEEYRRKEKNEDELPIIWDEDSKIYEVILDILETNGKDMEKFTLFNTQHWPWLGYNTSSSYNWIEIIYKDRL